MSNYCYVSIQDIAMMKEFPFTLGQLRHHLLKRQTNGLDKAVRKIGKRLYLRKDLFEQWVEKGYIEG